MKCDMKIHKKRDTHPGDDLFAIVLRLDELTEREMMVAMDTIKNKLYPDVSMVALTPMGVP
jgi:hypothetical protein